MVNIKVMFRKEHFTPVRRPRTVRPRSVIPRTQILPFSTRTQVNPRWTEGEVEIFFAHWSTSRVRAEIQARTPFLGGLYKGHCSSVEKINHKLHFPVYIHFKNHRKIHLNQKLGKAPSSNENEKKRHCASSMATSALSCSHHMAKTAEKPRDFSLI